MKPDRAATRSWRQLLTIAGTASLMLQPIEWAGIRAAPDRSKTPPEERAVQYLAAEVPRWVRENKCFSCHNNGDAARALYVARRMGYAVPDHALSDTSGFLSDPGQWDRNGPEGLFSDKRLARIQFAATLVSAHRAGVVADRTAVSRAAGLVAEIQGPDGSWSIDTAEPIGSPATYGRSLATALTRETLQSVDAEWFRSSIDRAGSWLRKLPVRNTLDAAAVLLSADDSPAWSAQQQQALSLLGRGQSDDGGWGPYVASPSEPFDTAVALLALVRWREQSEVPAMMRRGRAYLLATQLADGSWPETTRPAGAESYAQRLSTAGWAAQALLATK
jgi:hypothetical protein